MYQALDRWPCQTRLTEEGNCNFVGGRSSMEMHLDYHG